MPNDDTKVVLQQTLMNVEEVFIYRVPPLKTAGGHRAENWDLAKPLQTCTMAVERRDNTCIVRLMSMKPKAGGPPGAVEPKLFAQCNILAEEKKVEHFCEAVVDSSRYFVLRIVDPKSGRSAHIGMGFRDRDDATNFRMALQDYEKSMQRERLAKQQQRKQQEAEQQQQEQHIRQQRQQMQEKASKLTLKDGEKIHIQLKGHETKDRPRSGTGGGGPVPLLKKPPPPADVQIALPQELLDGEGRRDFDDGDNAGTVDSEDAVADEDDELWENFRSPGGK